ncbi:MAG TPA: ABC transporter ATP-binding protein [Armatimonadota bacterium]|nr:ABC transporter ATP-binding protein [Armatimonadota bacterium]
MFEEWYNSPIIRYVRMYRNRWLAVTLCILMALSVSSLLMPVPYIWKRFVDNFLPNKDIHGIIIYGLMAIGLYIANFMLGVGQRYFTLKTTKSVIYELRSRVCTKLQELCLSYYDNTNIGRLHARAMIDTEQVDVASNAIVTQILVSVTSFTIAFVILIRLNVILTIILLTIAPLSYLAVRILRRRMRESQRNFRNQRETLSSSIHDLLNSIRLIKSFGMEHLEEDKLNRNIQKYLSSGIRMATIGSLFGNLIMCFGGLSIVAVWTVGALLVINGKMTLGEVVAFTGFQGFLLNPINQLAAITETLYSGNTALKAVFELLDEDLIEFPEEGDPVEAITGEVTFDNVEFTYSDGTKALENVSLCAKPGQQIALVGESGSGKSTLIHLILGLYLPTDGHVYIDGHDITSLNLRSLRRQMGIVSQETILVAGTIRDNIRYGAPSSTEENIIEAAKEANAHSFITQFPNGYNAPTGEDGVKLSGGQRQRLAIARALLRDPRILILDEATSALDSESEAQVQEALEKLRKNRTTFVIAHRLSTILSSDRILVMKKGKIVEQGTHLELLAMHGEYARLYHTQFHRAMSMSAQMAQQQATPPATTK